MRGAVRDPTGEGLPGATVSVTDVDRDTRTNANGEFVLFLAPATDEDVTVDDGAVQIKGAPPVLSVSHPDRGSTTDTLEDSGGRSLVREGELTVRNVAYP